MAANPVPAPELQLSTEKKDGEIVVRGTGRINAATSAALQAAVRELIPQTKRIVIDLTGIEYVDSSGLGALVSIYMAANNSGSELEISNPRQRIRDLFKMSKLSSVVEGHGENYSAECDWLSGPRRLKRRPLFSGGTGAGVTAATIAEREAHLRPVFTDFAIVLLDGLGLRCHGVERQFENGCHGKV